MLFNANIEKAVALEMMLYNKLLPERIIMIAI